MDTLQLLTGLLVSGESIVLFIGMKTKKSDWLNPVNKGYIVFDIIVGATLVASSLGVIPAPVVLIFASIITHFLRNYDHYKKVPSRYAFNLPLLVLLNIRLLGLVFIIQQ